MRIKRTAHQDTSRALMLGLSVPRSLPLQRDLMESFGVVVQSTLTPRKFPMALSVTHREFAAFFLINQIF